MTMAKRAGFEALEEARIETSIGSTIYVYYSAPTTDAAPASKPVLLLLHGWPQSGYMWRHIVPTLIETGYRVVVPDLPGYGLSTPSSKGHDRLTLGRGLYDVVSDIYGKQAEVILVTHDRGARIGQALSSHRDQFPDINLKAIVIMDIVPYKMQWAAMADGGNAMGIFHWAFLARTDVSVPLIKAIGGGKFAELVIVGGDSGKSQECRDSFNSGDAMEHYKEMYAQESVIEAAAEDYKAGATIDFQRSKEDLENGYLVDVPALVLYSATGVGTMHKVPEIWKQWVKPGVRLETKAIHGGAGHFFLEENPRETIPLIMSFLQSFQS